MHSVHRGATLLMSVALFLGVSLAASAGDIHDQVEHHYAKNGDVKIHYVTVGEGPVILFVHGFPDYWYSWRHQMAGLSGEFKCVALDTRGYNKSDKPTGVANYEMEHLLGDLDAVIDDLGEEKIILTGHDWGGIIAWNFAMARPEKVDKLIILNLTHPRGFTRTLEHADERQQRNTDYARRFQAAEPEEGSTAAAFARAGADSDPKVIERYQAALGQSDLNGMYNYYKANYFKEPYKEQTDLPQVTCSVLQFHGLGDTAVDKDGLSKTWDWIDKDYTLVTLPGVSHWVQRDGAETVTTTMKWWLKSRQ